MENSREVFVSGQCVKAASTVDKFVRFSADSETHIVKCAVTDTEKDELEDGDKRLNTSTGYGEIVS